MRNSKRRGMLLLVVLALLAMFAMLAVAFVVVASGERSTAVKVQAIEIQSDPPEKQLNAVANIVVRGGPPVSCPIQSICLMEKLVGNDLYRGQLQSSDMQPVIGYQLLTLNLDNSSDPAICMHKVGCTLTMLTGPAAGLSTKIVGVQPVPPQPNQPPQLPTVSHIAAFPGGAMPNKGDSYIINGYPYSGMGFGYNPATGLLDAKDNNGPLALQPRNPTNWNPPGGANCDYTAPDFQDPLLAYATTDLSGAVIVPIPSLHRADLIQHWTKVNKKQLTADQMRLISYRPIGANSGVSGRPDHPNFTGSNLSFNSSWSGLSNDPNSQGQWDVDNMGTGRPDSIWVDLGMPIRHTPDGRAYKPLFAILCLDLDGRLNLNAHGNLAQAQPNYYQNVTLSNSSSLPNDVPVTWPQGRFAGPANIQPQSGRVVRGQGIGPAEVNLAPLFSASPGSFDSPYANLGNFNLGTYQALLQGAKNTMLAGDQLGRYGDYVGSGVSGGTANKGYNTLNFNRWFSYSESFWVSVNNGTPIDAWGSPPDTQGFGAVALDLAGRPLYLSMGGLLNNTPYDLDLSPNAARATGTATPDSPYSIGELERVLRAFDRDATTLPNRLLALTTAGAPSPLLRHLTDITTDSYSIPVPPAVTPEPLRDMVPNDKRTRHPVDAAAAAVIAATGNAPDKAAWAALADLLPWEILQGQKMNINRPFGAGARTSNGKPVPPTTQVVDADQPNQMSENVLLNTSTALSSTASAPLAYDATAFLATNSLAARQLYAKHLYVLMMLSADLPGIDAQTGSPDATARLIAQWAVNVVAYRDHNSIMIPFNYDPYPFGNRQSGKKPGWAPDNKEAHTVWGCKRPDLLIMETLAFHDRRTEDLDNEVPDGARDPAFTKIKDPAAKDPDPNFDQKYRPQGSLFVELYNPWTQYEAQSRDLLFNALGNNVSGVDLTQTTYRGSGSPVWRLVIVKPPQGALPNNELPDPDDPVAANRPTVERVVYFVPAGKFTVPTGENPPIPASAVYTPSTVPSRPVVTPGQYAVIGSGELDSRSLNRKQTLIGLDPKNRKIDSRAGRYITLDETELATNPYVIRNNQPATPAGFTPQPLVAIAVDTPHRLSVSEPVGGYGPYEKTKNGQMTYNPATEMYDGKDSIDIPLDVQRDANEPGVSTILSNDGTTTHYRIIYLQRLADPTRPHNATIDGNPNLANPYRTIDAMPIDLTTFNGVTRDKDPNNAPKATQFAARQRGDTNATSGEFNLWKQETYDRKIVAQQPDLNKTSIFPNELASTLGYLNTQYYGPVAPSPTTAPLSYLGDPPAPFPWLTWAYRPFVNEYELLLVPALQSSKLLAHNEDPNPNAVRKYYGYVDQAMRPNVADSYGTGPTNFPYLLNMFQSGANGQTGQFHRVLAYLGVPTPYTHFANQASLVALANSTVPHSYHQPFNGIPTYREPGRINLNTISSADVFMGLLNYHPGLTTPDMWSRFFLSRCGDPTKKAADMTINPAYPSRFMRPFRSAGGAWLSTPLADGTANYPSREIDVTLMRSDPLVNGRPLLQVDDINMNPAKPSSGVPTPDQFQYAAMDYNRNPYFRYQGIQKLASTTTTHSNVFAIWITVGYFDALPAADPNRKDQFGNFVYPDGYELGQELGADTGDVTRHRAFYIFDRSLPVGFIRGQDINTDKGFLLKRYIE